MSDRATMIYLPDKRCACGTRKRPVWLFGRILRWTCDRCNPPPRAMWTLKVETPNWGDTDGQ